MGLEIARPFSPLRSCGAVEGVRLNMEWDLEEGPTVCRIWCRQRHVMEYPTWRRSGAVRIGIHGSQEEFCGGRTSWAAVMIERDTRVDFKWEGGGVRVANSGERQLLACRRAGDRVSRVEAMVGYWLRRLYSGAKEEERASLRCVRAVRGCDKEAEASKRLTRRNETINQSIRRGRGAGHVR